MENIEIEKQLLNLPEQIAKQQLELISKKSQMLDIQAMSEAEALKEIISINNATDEKGKKLYSNEQARNAVLNERLQENVGYAQLKGKTEELKLEVMKLEIEIQKQGALFGAYRSIAEMRGVK